MDLQLLLSGVLSIVVIDLVLSGDNAVVIGMAAYRLPPGQRRFAVLFGGGAAIALRIMLTFVAALLLTLPALKAIGGALLLWIAFKMFKEEEETTEEVKVAANLRSAIFTILLADFIMSTDNILGVAAASHGSFELLLFGLILSMTILMIGGSLVANLINRIPWLIYLGAAVIAWTGTEMFLSDELVGQSGALPHGWEMPAAALVTVVTIAAAHYFHRQRPAWQRARLEREGAEGTSGKAETADPDDARTLPRSSV